jgi:glycine/D-amino acid oxidase-like deaminating enzyme
MGPHSPVTRRAFSAALIGLSQKSERRIEGGFVDDGAAAGHRMRDGLIRTRAAETIRVPVVIVGGGMAGLSAAWRLDQRGFRDFVLLELNQQPGGNARWGENSITAFPWAAHYVPVPNRESLLMRELLEELGVLRNGKPEERYLCHSPQERLFLHGRWQEGLEPELAATVRDRDQFRRFRARMLEFRGTREFTIPIGLGARASELDQRSMSAWMREQGFDSPYLIWYVDYACRDDYGAHVSETSAWAGVHYFASREHEEQGPLTWPEGNGWITRRLARKLTGYLRCGTPVHRIVPQTRGLAVHAADKVYIADHVIFAAPSFLAAYLIPGTVRAPIEYSPWVTANITLDRLPRERGFPLAWDNVIYDSPSLGYVVATHMTLRRHVEGSVWTWYHALATGQPAMVRRMLLARPWHYWKEFILDDLARAHPDIRDCVTRIDVLRLGHAMARPVPGSMFRHAPASPSPRLHFANSDLSGLSIIEEAQWRGVRAADDVLSRG